MNDVMHETAMDTTTTAPVMIAPVRPFYWSVRRELWENRSIYLAPLAVAIVILFGFLVSTIGMAHRRRAVMLLDEAHQRAGIGEPYNASAMILVAIAFIIGAFYCLDALYGERKDRSILFWKSLPVSDRTTVLSKASIPLVILPSVIFAIILVLHLIMAVWSTLLLLTAGLDSSMVFVQYRFIPSPFIVLYGLVAVALWHAPIYAWLLLVSAWARRAAVLVAMLPFVVVMIFETLTFHTSHFAKWIGYRLAGGFGEAFAVPAKQLKGTQAPVHITPLNFLMSPGLWFGLLVAAAFLAAAIRVRRNREPI